MTSSKNCIFQDEKKTWKPLVDLVDFALALKEHLNEINQESFNQFVLRVGESKYYICIEKPTLIVNKHRLLHSCFHTYAIFRIRYENMGSGTSVIKANKEISVTFHKQFTI